MLWISVGILIIQIIVALVSYLTVYRHRAIYGLKTAVLRMPHGTEIDGYVGLLNTDHIDRELIGGKYTVLQMVERVDKDLEIILGRIKK